MALGATFFFFGPALSGTAETSARPTITKDLMFILPPLRKLTAEQKIVCRKAVSMAFLPAMFQLLLWRLWRLGWFGRVRRRCLDGSGRSSGCAGAGSSLSATELLRGFHEAVRILGHHALRVRMGFQVSLEFGM